ncbi:hypothetical protein Tco_0582837 [Tanacetum coccineum]
MKHAGEPKTKDQRKNEEDPKSCESCHKHVKGKPKSCKCESSCCRKEKEYLSEQERFLAYHEPQEYTAPRMNKKVCRDIHCKDHNKRPYIRPSSIEPNVPPPMIHPQMTMPPMVYHQRPPFYHPNRSMYPPPPPPPRYSAYDRSMQMYRSPYGGGYRDNFWNERGGIDLGVAVGNFFAALRADLLYLVTTAGGLIVVTKIQLILSSNDGDAEVNPNANQGFCDGEDGNRDEELVALGESYGEALCDKGGEGGKMMFCLQVSIMDIRCFLE